MGLSASKGRHTAPPCISPWSALFGAGVEGEVGVRGGEACTRGTVWLVVLNEWANHARHNRLRVALHMLDRLREEGVELHVLQTSGPGHALTALAGGAAEAVAADAVMVLGGDGTTSEVVNGLAWWAVKKHARLLEEAGFPTGEAGSGVWAGRGAWEQPPRPSASTGQPRAAVRLPPLALVPTGTSNTTAYCCGITSVEDAEAAIRGGVLRTLDVLEVSRQADAHPGGRLADTGHRSWLERAMGLPPVQFPVPMPPATSESARRAGGPFSPSAAVTCSSHRDLRAVACFSVMFVGWGRASAALADIEAARVKSPVLQRLSDRRACWCKHFGACELACATTGHVVDNAHWLAGVRFVVPLAPLLPTGCDLEAVRQSVVSSHGGVPVGSLAHARTVLPDASGAVAHTAVTVHHLHPDERGERGGEGTCCWRRGAPPATDAGAGDAPHAPLVRPPPSTLAPVAMLQIQSTPYLGHNMPFCPFARVDDGLLDVVALMGCTRAQSARYMAAVRARGRHMLRGRAWDGHVLPPLPYVRYAQAVEVELDTPSQAQLDAWLDGGEGGEGEGRADLSCPAAARRGPGPDEERERGGRDWPALHARDGVHPSVPPGPPAARRNPALAAARVRSGVCPLALHGERTLNVDGELTGFMPCRVRTVHAALPVYVHPLRPAAIRVCD